MKFFAILAATVLGLAVQSHARPGPQSWTFKVQTEQEKEQKEWYETHKNFCLAFATGAPGEKCDPNDPVGYGFPLPPDVEPRPEQEVTGGRLDPSWFDGIFGR